MHAATYAVDLVVLDTTDPGQVAAALSSDLDRTVVVAVYGQPAPRTR